MNKEIDLFPLSVKDTTNDIGQNLNFKVQINLFNLHNINDSTFSP